MENYEVTLEQRRKKLYHPPEIVHELELETRAGSALPTTMPIIIPGEGEGDYNNP